MNQDPVLIAYIVFVAVYFLMENVVMNRIGGRLHLSSEDRSLLYVLIPFYLVILAAPLEYLYLSKATSMGFWVCGALFFVAGTLLRMKAHIDLGTAFSYSIKHPGDQKIVKDGLYRVIRHPLYLANLMIMIAAPLFLANRFTWLLTIIGFAGIHARILIEEAHLKEEYKDYAAYMQKTWKLIPRIY